MKVAWSRLPALAGFVILSEAAGVVGSVFTAAAVPAWYALLQKPALAPPSWLFGPVWTTLYLLMGIAAFLVWSAPAAPRLRRAALLAFGLQLALNALWSMLFFGLRSPLSGLVGIAALWLAIVWCIARFARVSPAAAWLLAPYLAWVSFASYLNFALWSLN